MPEYTKQLVNLGITTEDRSSWGHLSKYASYGPYINWSWVSWRTK